MNFFRSRSNLFNSVVHQYVPEGRILPWWAVSLRTLLFPREMLGHFLSRPNHYDVWTDTYLIHGVRYNGALFRTFANPDESQLYRFKRKGEMLTVERVELPAPQEPLP
jgi:hypothetical protein